MPRQYSQMVGNGDESRAGYTNTTSDAVQGENISVYNNNNTHSSGDNTISTPRGPMMMSHELGQRLPSMHHHHSLPMSRIQSSPSCVESTNRSSRMQRGLSVSSCGIPMSRSTSYGDSSSHRSLRLQSRRRKRSFTEGEKLHIALVREVGACLRCHKAHRRCPHALTTRDAHQIQFQSTETNNLAGFSQSLVPDNRQSTLGLSREPLMRPHWQNTRTPDQQSLARVDETREMSSFNGQYDHTHPMTSDRGVLSTPHYIDSRRRSDESIIFGRNENDGGAVHPSLGSNAVQVLADFTCLPSTGNPASPLMESFESQAQQQYIPSIARELQAPQAQSLNNYAIPTLETWEAPQYGHGAGVFSGYSLVYAQSSTPSSYDDSSSPRYQGHY